MMACFQPMLLCLVVCVGVISKVTGDVASLTNDTTTATPTSAATSIPAAATTIPATATTIPATATTTPATAATTPATATTIPATAATTPATATTTPATATTTPATAATTPATATTGVPPIGTTTQAPTGATTEAGQTTTMTGNSTGNTTSTTSVPTTATPLPVVPRFQVNNSDGQPCMLLNFNALLTVKYPTNHKGIQTARIPITNTTFVEGSCTNGTLRKFTLYYPTNNTYCAFLTLFFNTTNKTTYYNREGIYLRYIEPCFLADATHYNTDTGGHLSPSYYGTVGKSFRCQSIFRSGKKVDANLTMDDILIQPFAQMSADKGSYGDVETCPKALPTTPVTPITPTTKPHPPTKPSPSNAGMIVGIIIGVIAVVGAIVAIAVYVMRKRHYKAITYGNLENDPPRAI